MQFPADALLLVFGDLGDLMLELASPFQHRQLGIGFRLPIANCDHGNSDGKEKGTSDRDFPGLDGVIEILVSANKIDPRPYRTGQSGDYERNVTFAQSTGEQHWNAIEQSQRPLIASHEVGPANQRQQKQRKEEI